MSSVQNQSSDPAPGANAVGADEVLNKKQLAARLKVATRTIENWMHRGVIPFIEVKKVRLFIWEDVLKRLKANHQVCRRNFIR